MSTRNNPEESAASLPFTSEMTLALQAAVAASRDIQHTDMQEHAQCEVVQTLQSQALSEYIRCVTQPRQAIATETVSLVADVQPISVWGYPLRSRLFPQSPRFSDREDNPDEALRHYATDMNAGAWVMWRFSRFDEVGDATVRTQTDVHINASSSEEMQNTLRTLSNPVYNQPTRKSTLLGVGTEREGWRGLWHYDPMKLRAAIGNLAVQDSQAIYAESRAYIVGEPEANNTLLKWACVHKFEYSQVAPNTVPYSFRQRAAQMILQEVIARNQDAAFDDKTLIHEISMLLEEKSVPNPATEANYKKLSIINDVIRTSHIVTQYTD